MPSSSTVAPGGFVEIENVSGPVAFAISSAHAAQMHTHTTARRVVIIVSLLPKNKGSQILISARNSQLWKLRTRKRTYFPRAAGVSAGSFQCNTANSIESVTTVAGEN